eukprot:TRINITY_DN54467_c0_g1_i1.p1 TRINITY_DN54467_c0_g1~~TRINITY_DN54467_c0_g1_i1.p1  ORF type:complete len:614 (-),score=57.92 TRINITY_DN54467_c0_g1_i1:179-2020(-)
MPSHLTALLRTWFLNSFCVAALKPDASPHYEVCVVPATEHVHFQAKCANLDVARQHIEINAMQQEYESVQILIRGSDRFAVNLEGSSIPLPLKWYQVGFVDTKANKRVEGSGGGWRPDPLLSIPEDVSSVQVPAAFTQPLWLTWHMNISTKASYTGDVKLRFKSASGYLVSFSIPVKVRIFGFAVPDVRESLAKQFWKFTDESLYSFYGNWSRMKEVMPSFHDVLYRNRVPTTGGSEVLGESPIVQFKLDMRAVPKGCNGKIDQALLTTAIVEAQAKVEELLAQGWPREAIYGYGMDEPPETCAPLLREVYNAFRAGVPDVKLIAATNWDSEHMTPDFPLHAWVHGYENYREEDAAQWINAGKEYWGYHCIEPHKAEYLNTFIERPLIEARLLFWLAASRRYQGWLYYETNLYRECAHKKHAMLVGNDTHPALVSFDPANYIWCPDINDIFANGDGYFVYPGLSGAISTQRLEVIRDGLEDWELFRALLPGAPQSHDRSAIDHFTSQLVQSAVYSAKAKDSLRLQTVRTEALKEVEKRVATSKMQQTKSEQEDLSKRTMQTRVRNSVTKGSSLRNEDATARMKYVLSCVMLILVVFLALAYFSLTRTGHRGTK